jgi:hypothetical protein
LIAARKQPVNRDAREVALLTAQLLLARNANEQALRQAQAAVDLARAEAVDPQSSAWIGEALVWRASRKPLWDENIAPQRLRKRCRIWCAISILPIRRLLLARKLAAAQPQ